MGKPQICNLGQGPRQHQSCESVAHPDVPCESLCVTGLTGGSGEGVAVDANATWTLHVFFFPLWGPLSAFTVVSRRKMLPRAVDSL